MAESVVESSHMEEARGSEDFEEGEREREQPRGANADEGTNGTLDGIVDPGRSNHSDEAGDAAVLHDGGEDGGGSNEPNDDGGDDDGSGAPTTSGGGEQVDESGRQLDLEVTMIGAFDGNKWTGKWGMSLLDAEGNDETKKSSFSYTVKAPAGIYPPAPSSATPVLHHGLMDVVLDGSFKMKVVKGEKTVKEHNIVMRFGDSEGEDPTPSSSSSSSSRVKVRGGGKNHIGPFVLTGFINLATREMRLARWYVAELPKPYQHVAPRRAPASSAPSSTSSSLSARSIDKNSTTGGEGSHLEHRGDENGGGGETTEGGKFPQRVRRPPALLTVDDQRREANRRATVRVSQVLERVRKLDKFGYFERPVDPVALNIPTYFEVIKRPMDLGTVRNRLNAGEYANEEEAAADVRLTFTNATTFNPDTNHVHQTAKALLQEFDADMEKLQAKALMKRAAASNAGIGSWRNVEVAVPPPKKSRSGVSGWASSSRAPGGSPPRVTGGSGGGGGAAAAGALPPKSRSGKSKRKSSSSVKSRFSDVFGAEDEDDDDEEEQDEEDDEDDNEEHQGVAAANEKGGAAPGATPAEVVKMMRQMEEMQRKIETLTKTQQQQQQQQVQQQAAAARTAAVAPAPRGHHAYNSNVYTNPGAKPPQPRAGGAMAASSAASTTTTGVLPRTGHPPPEERVQERPMTYQEKFQLTENISSLPASKVVRVVQIIRESRAELMKLGGEGEETVEIDLESLDNATLRKLQKVVQEFIREERKMVLKTM